jgi:hypothetical protein
MRIHKNARLTPILREELAGRVIHNLLPLSAGAAEFNLRVAIAVLFVREEVLFRLLRRDDEETLWANRIPSPIMLMPNSGQRPAEPCPGIM